MLAMLYSSELKMELCINFKQSKYQIQFLQLVFQIYPNCTCTFTIFGYFVFFKKLKIFGYILFHAYDSLEASNKAGALTVYFDKVNLVRETKDDYQ